MLHAEAMQRNEGRRPVWGGGRTGSRRVGQTRQADLDFNLHVSPVASGGRGSVFRPTFVCAFASGLSAPRNLSSWLLPL